MGISHLMSRGHRLQVEIGRASCRERGEMRAGRGGARGRARARGRLFFSSRRRHTRWPRDWSSDVCSSDLKRVFLPNGMATDIEKECDDFEALIKKHGPIDLQILGVGVNGHIAFNEPGTSFTSRDRKSVV